MRFFLTGFLIAMLGCSGVPNGNENLIGAGAPASSAPQNPPLNVVKVILTSPDNVRIVGSLYETFNPNSPALLLLHQWGSDRHSFDDLANAMQSKGYNVLTIDGRGFGESIKTIDNKNVTPTRTNEVVRAMLGDIATAFDFLAKQKNVNPNKIRIVGASYGSSLALIYGADHPNVAAVALLSPGLNYFGNMPTQPAVKRYGDRPLYFISGYKQDLESFEAVKRLNPHQGERVKYESTAHPDGEHGTALLKVGAAEELEDFFSRHLKSPK